MQMSVNERIQQLVDSNPVIVFMKGTPQFPQCGFSARAVQVLQQSGTNFAHVNVLEDPEIFQGLPAFADFPTFPQTYISGELIGGSDILIEMMQNGELKQMLDEIAA
jgi:monothiol glutaredoxin